MSLMNISVPTNEELKSYQMIAEIASSNPHWKKLGGGGTEAQVIATILSVMLLARELGIAPMQAISGGINNIQGKFEISAKIMNQLIRKHGHKIQVKIVNNEVCSILGKRKDTGEEQEASYHIEEAARAGLIRDGGGWKKNPQDMLFARAISRLARRLFPDCIGGCYIEGELQESILKQAVEGIEMPSSDEINVDVTPVLLSLNFEIPQDISKNEIEEFISESSQVSGKPKEAIYQRANQNPDGFLEAFKKWNEKPSTEELALEMTA